MNAGRALLAFAIAAALTGGGFALGRATDDDPGSTSRSVTTPTPTPTELPKGPPRCGPAPARPGGGTWVCTFSDEFDGRTLDRERWEVLTTARSNYTNGGECFLDSPANVSVSGGALHLTLRREEQPVTCTGLPEGVSPLTPYTSGMVTTTGKFSQAYGRFEFRVRFPTRDESGLHGAVWLWPEDESRYGGRPAAGEIDIAEFYTQYPDRVVPYLHFDEAVAGQGVTNTDCFMDRPDQFHVYALEWTPETMTITYDGTVCLQTTWQARGLVRPAPFDVPFFLNLTQALGRGTNAPEDDLELPATMDVDYVRVWS